MPRKKTDLSQRLEAVIKTLVPQQEQNPDDLGPMMRAIKAVHSISDHTSTTPEDLEHQRAAQELFGRLVTPSIGIRNDSLTVGSIPAEWGQPGARPRPPPRGFVLPWRRLHLRPAGLCPHSGQQVGACHRV